MKISYLLTSLLIALLLACSGSDSMEEINALIDAGKIPQAKMKYKEMVEDSGQQSLYRQYIHFLHDQNQYLDFRREVSAYLREYPDDKELRLLQFQHYAQLATDAERQGNYALALDYIVTRLLSTDFPDYKQWENRQTTVLSKWFEAAKEKEDLNMQKEVLIQMRNLGFENLAKSVAPELYQSIEGKSP